MQIEKTEDATHEVVSTEIPVQQREYPFTEEQIAEMDSKMDNIRANYMTIEELGRRNREISKELHDYIREIHPALKEVDYMYNPVSKKIQFREKQ